MIADINQHTFLTFLTNRGTLLSTATAAITHWRGHETAVTHWLLHPLPLYTKYFLQIFFFKKSETKDNLLWNWPTYSYKFISEVKPAHIWVLPLSQYLFVAQPFSWWTLNPAQWPVLIAQICASDIMLLGDWELVTSLPCTQGERGDALDACPCASPRFLFAKHTQKDAHSSSPPAIFNFRVTWMSSWHTKLELTLKETKKSARDSWEWKENERERALRADKEAFVR